MNRFSPSGAHMLLALVFCLHLACSTTAPLKTLQAPPGMVLIPNGTFLMGCTNFDMGTYDWAGPCCAGPRHKVTVKEFLMDATEVTVKDYQECVRSGKCENPKYIPSCNWVHDDRGTHPMNCIDWLYANRYCEWRGKRLPSEAEWEYAARAGHDEWSYPWGNEKADCSRAIMNENQRKGCGLDHTWPARSKPPNDFGLFDLAGNVMEWTADCMNQNYNDAPNDGSAWKIGDCRTMILKGGSWADEALYLRATCRMTYEPESTKFSELVLLNFNRPIAQVGFRCAKSVE